MTEKRDFKRVVRTRMQRTGESYTAARARLLEKDKDRGQTLEPPLDDYAALAGMSDEAVEAKTGCGWDRWVAALDHAGAHSMAHADIARYVRETWDLPEWWIQTVTVGYERIKGLREKGQRRDGTFDLNKSRTLPVPLARLYRAFEDPEVLRQWLPDSRLEIRRTTPEKSIRATWSDGRPLDVHFTARGEAKSQVTLQHRRLPSRDAVERLRDFWSRRLEALAEVLAG